MAPPTKFYVHFALWNVRESRDKQIIICFIMCWFQHYVWQLTQNQHTFLLAALTFKKTSKATDAKVGVRFSLWQISGSAIWSRHLHRPSTPTFTYRRHISVFSVSAKGTLPELNLDKVINCFDGTEWRPVESARKSWPKGRVLCVVSQGIVQLLVWP